MLLSRSVHDACRNVVSDAQRVDFLHFLVQIAVKGLPDVPALIVESLYGCCFLEKGFQDANERLALLSIQTYHNLVEQSEEREEWS